MNKFFDVGYHQGQGLRWFREQYAMGDDWLVYCFEPNPANHGWFQMAPNIVNLPLAAWTRDGSVNLYRHEMGNGLRDGEASSVMEGWQQPDLLEPIEVPCIDFAMFLLHNTVANDNVVVKLDVEGAEYPICRRLLDMRAAQRIANLHVEFHHRCLESEDSESTEQLREWLGRLTVLHDHW